MRHGGAKQRALPRALGAHLHRGRRRRGGFGRSGSGGRWRLHRVLEAGVAGLLRLLVGGEERAEPRRALARVRRRLDAGRAEHQRVGHRGRRAPAQGHARNKPSARWERGRGTERAVQMYRIQHPGFVASARAPERVQGRMAATMAAAKALLPPAAPALPHLRAASSPATDARAEKLLSWLRAQPGVPHGSAASLAALSDGAALAAVASSLASASRGDASQATAVALDGKAAPAARLAAALRALDAAQGLSLPAGADAGVLRAFVPRCASPHVQNLAVR